MRIKILLDDFVVVKFQIPVCSSTQSDFYQFCFFSGFFQFSSINLFFISFHILTVNNVVIVLKRLPKLCAHFISFFQFSI